jgi:hypothetical protein
MLLALLPITLSAQERTADFQASAWLALTSDTFAAKAQRDLLYQNLDASSGKRERLTGGFDFAYRLTGGRGPQVWIFGQTAHGTRSAEVACEGDTLCIANGRQLVRLLRGSASLEGRMGLRMELLRLHPRGSDTAALYVKATAGFLTIAQGGDAYDTHGLAAGFLATTGRYADSYLEAGWGRNDVFQLNRYRRNMVNGFLTWSSAPLQLRGMRPFVSIQVDSDLGRSADSIQTSLGVTFNLERLF